MTPDLQAYTKSYMDVGEQLALLESRGMLVEDRAEAIACLTRYGYYRLSAYWYPFRSIVGGARAETFQPGSKFEDVVHLYGFDKDLKLLMLDAIERVEIAVRVRIALHLGAIDPFAHTHAKLFDTAFAGDSGDPGYVQWLKRIELAASRSKADFMTHFRSTYTSGSPLPIWIAVELWDFGTLAHAFRGMQSRDRTAVAAYFGIPDERILTSWLRSLNYVRNVIAHHGRLWNASIVDYPWVPRSNQIGEFGCLAKLPRVATRVDATGCILAYLTHIINPGSPWIRRMRTLVSSFPVVPKLGITDMGFPSDWLSHPFWINS